MNDKKIYPAIVASIVKDVPDYKVVSKDDSAFMKLLGGIMFFNPSFMTSFVTTIGPTTYAPAKDIAANRWEVIAHEGVHARDSERMGSAAFKLLYLFPQCLASFAALALLAPLSHWFLLALVFLVCLAPLPAPGRVWAERRGYLMSGCMDALSGTKIHEAAYIDWMTDHFTTGQYYFMHWGRAGMRQAIINDMAHAQRLVDGVEVLEPYTSAIAVARQADKS